MKYLVEPQNIMTKEDCNINCTCFWVHSDTCPLKCSSNCTAHCIGNCIGNCPGRCYRAVPYNKLEDE